MVSQSTDPREWLSWVYPTCGTHMKLDLAQIHDNITPFLRFIYK